MHNRFNRNTEPMHTLTHSVSVACEINKCIALYICTNFSLFNEVTLTLQYHNMTLNLETLRQ